MDNLSKYLSSPETEEISVQSRYSYIDQVHMKTSNIDVEGMLKYELTRKLVDALIDKGLVEFKTINTTNPYEASVTISARVKVQPPYLNFTLSGML